MIYIGKFYFGSKKRTVNQSLSKKLLFVLTFYCFYSSALAQNEILARIEFEAAEELHVQEKYNEALKKIEKTGSLLEKWTPMAMYNDLAKKRHDQFGNLFVFNRLIRQN